MCVHCMSAPQIDNKAELDSSDWLYDRIYPFHRELRRLRHCNPAQYLPDRPLGQRRCPHSRRGNPSRWICYHSCSTTLPGYPVRIHPRWPRSGFAARADEYLRRTHAKLGPGSRLPSRRLRAYLLAFFVECSQQVGLIAGFFSPTQGIGGATSPLIATLFVSAGIRFSYFFSVSLAVAALNVLILLLAFRLEREAEPSTAKISAEDDPSVPLATMQSRQTPTSTRPPTREGLPDEAVPSTQATGGQIASQPVQIAEHRGKALLRDKTVWVVNGFLLLYCGAEVSIGGWIVGIPTVRTRELDVGLLQGRRSLS